ncbi:hypothetical protein GYMLUDRAFT_75117 [Collybiopsis luxurians FD-317 M1]|uniref:Uncharacterized protein n=1 Tax=Collybiopsis luxurians FD-317 M1 TaxID=944289 RepID=A0A0D0B485_9AGAR|nr:hypothetical protein GYMLUDRAFT_75117 [Collybiopsis luxurians FD-317 M1]
MPAALGASSLTPSAPNGHGASSRLTMVMATFTVPLHSGSPSTYTSARSFSFYPQSGSQSSSSSSSFAAVNSSYFASSSASYPGYLLPKDAALGTGSRKRKRVEGFNITKGKEKVAEGVEDEEEENHDDEEARSVDSYQNLASRKVLKVLHPEHYDSGPSMMEALGKCFKAPSNNTFLGTYHAMNTPEISDKHRIQLVIHEIWKVTGYRFTVKDHPPAKNGHTTRLWCSQDSQRKGNTRYPSNNAKQRFPCRSRLLVSSRDSKLPGFRLVTVRMYHYVPHEPYSDPTTPGNTYTIPNGSSKPTIAPSNLDDNPAPTSCSSKKRSPPVSSSSTHTDNNGVPGQGHHEDRYRRDPNTEPQPTVVSSDHFTSSTIPSISQDPSKASLISSNPPKSKGLLPASRTSPITIHVEEHPLYAVQSIYSVLSNPMITIGQMQTGLATRGPAYHSNPPHAPDVLLPSVSSPSPSHLPPHAVSQLSVAQAPSAPAGPSTPQNANPVQIQRRIRAHIQTLRDFCNSLDYQLQFNDPVHERTMLEELELKGKDFLEYVGKHSGSEAQGRARASRKMVRLEGGEQEGQDGMRGRNVMNSDAHTDSYTDVHDSEH